MRVQPREVSWQTPDQRKKSTPGTIHPDRSRVRLLAYLVTARSRCCSPLEERRTQFSAIAGYRSRHLQQLVDCTAHQVRPGISGLVAGPGQTHWSEPLPRSDILTFSTSYRGTVDHWKGYQACNFIVIIDSRFTMNNLWWVSVYILIRLDFRHFAILYDAHDYYLFVLRLKHLESVLWLLYEQWLGFSNLSFDTTIL